MTEMRCSVRRPLSLPNSYIDVHPINIEEKVLILKNTESVLPLSDGVGETLVLPLEYRPFCFIDCGKIILYPEYTGG